MKMTATVCGCAAMAMGLAFLAGCNGEGGSMDTNVVKMTTGLKFEPAEITVQAGQTVQWRNDSIMAHTVTADPKLAKKVGDAVLPTGAKPFNSLGISPNHTFDYTFTVPGTYKYFCIPHETMGMVGTVIVTPADANAPPAAPAFTPMASPPPLGRRPVAPPKK